MLGISSPRLSEIMNGKAEPSLALARMISLKLNISPSIVLGV
ncbi:MAG: helix-turn-helix transcriptional regulator [Paludibacteraceae bacterium]|nr:helix-turn-helix transcriptional regulator [Paludibacteraceae bacterium]